MRRFFFKSLLLRGIQNFFAMKQLFKPGDIKEYRSVVTVEDLAAFQGVALHAVCSTFALARDIEWTTRQFVLDMKEEDEEGIGTYLEIEHLRPAFVGEEIIFQGKFELLTGNHMVCTFEVRVDDRTIARGKTGQKILKLDKIKSLFNHG
jgi:fluoroacetyl-CoA thioesterase